MGAWASHPALIKKNELSPISDAFLNFPYVTESPILRQPLPRAARRPPRLLSLRGESPSWNGPSLAVRRVLPASDSHAPNRQGPRTTCTAIKSLAARVETYAGGPTSDGCRLLGQWEDTNRKCSSSPWRSGTERRAHVVCLCVCFWVLTIVHAHV